MMTPFLVASLVTGWPDMKAPNLMMKRADINGKGLTCTGIMMSEAIHRNQRGENPDVPVGIISRFPMLDPVEHFISSFHVWCAFVLMIVVYGNFAGPKGNDPDPSRAAFHVWFGRVFSWLMAARARVRHHPPLASPSVAPQRPATGGSEHGNYVPLRWGDKVRVRGLRRHGG